MAPPDRQGGSSTAAPWKVPALELCFASTYDPLTCVRGAVLHFMAKAFRDQGSAWTSSPPLRNRLLFREGVEPHAFHGHARHLSSGRTDPVHGPAVHAEQIGDRFRRGNGTVVFSPGSIPVALLDPSIPHAFFADATFAGLLDEYPELEGYDEASPKGTNWR